MIDSARICNKNVKSEYALKHMSLYIYICVCVCVCVLHATEKTAANLLRKRIEKKTEHKLREDQSGFRRGKGNMGATGMLRITLERILVIDEECLPVSCTGRRTNCRIF